MNTGLGVELFDNASIQDPYPLYRRMLDACPIHRIGDSQFYAVCSWAAVNEVVARPDEFSSNLTATMMYHRDTRSVTPIAMGELGGITQALATADDPSHAVHRKMLLRRLAARRIRDSQPHIAETAARLWDLGLHNGQVEWMAAMANRLPMMVVARIIGVPDDDTEKLMRWGYSATQVVEGLLTEEDLTAAGIATLELSAYITEQFQAAAVSAHDSLLSDLAGACARGELDEITAQVMMVTLFSAGGESTASLIGSAAWILATRPDVQMQLRDRPELLDTFLEEVLRYEPPFRGHYRHVVNDTSLAGNELPAGSRLLLLWGCANRDETHFENPDEFRLDRVSAKDHIAFGKGAHFCVGAALARLEARIVIGGLLDRTTDIRVADVGTWLPSLLVRRLENLYLTCE